jgi:hypothetical protein
MTASCGHGGEEGERAADWRRARPILTPSIARRSLSTDGFGVEAAGGFTLGVGSYLLDSSDSLAITQQVSTRSLKHGDECRPWVISHMEL